MRRILTLVGAALLLSACAPEDLAAVVSQVQLPDLVLPELQSGTIGRDLFLFEDQIDFDGVVEGDLFASGETVSISGSVEGSIYTYGTDVTIDAEVNGGVFVLGREVEFGPTAQIGQGVVFAGMLLNMQEGSKVGGGVTAAGYQVILDGSIGQFVRGAMLRLRLDGTVGAGGNGLLPRFQGLVLNPHAPALSVARVGLARPAAEGGIAEDLQPVLDVVLRIGRELVTLLFFGLLAGFFRPTLFFVWADRVRVTPLVSTGYGIFVLIGGYIGGALAAVLIGVLTFWLISLGLDGLAMAALGIGGGFLILGMILLTLFAAYGTKLIVGTLLGRWILSRVAPAAVHSRFGPLLLGALVYVLLAAIPYFGQALAIVATLLGLGAVWLVWRDMRMARQI
ncbi:MAG TPA: polymer-forming cytoskeletal protein [Anaerolineales bacterium]|nr:polymer-forming cytoskeletal protein [Anaerolineales bacterium]